MVLLPSCDGESVSIFRHIENTRSVPALHWAITERESCHQSCEEWKSHCTVDYVYVRIAHSTVCKSVAHSGLYFAVYYFFFAELAHGESDPRFTILLFPCNKHRIRRLITLRAQNTWGKQPIENGIRRQAQTRLPRPSARNAS